MVQRSIAYIKHNSDKKMYFLLTNLKSQTIQQIKYI